MVTTIEGFDIRSHVEKLSPAKGKNRYHCPVCDGQNLTVCDKTGKYKCWNGCESKDIREAIAPWKGRSPQNDAWLEASRSVRASPKPKRPTPAVIPEGCPTLALLPEQPQLPQRIKGNDPRHGLVTTIQFPYSDTQWVQRKEWVDESKPKGRSKSILPYHVNGEGEVVCKKGEDYWLPYRMDEVEAFGAGNWVLLVEGESCVEVSRSIGVVSFTLQGASWTSEDLYAAFLQCKAANVAGVVMFPDNDDAGTDKTKKAAEAAAKAGVAFVILIPHDVWEEIPDAGDIADWIQWGRTNNMKRDDFIQKLQEQLSVSVEGTRQKQQTQQVRQEQSIALSAAEKVERRRLELKTIAQERDPDILIDKIVSFCRQTGWSRRDVESRIQTLKVSTNSPRAKLMRGADFLKQETEGLSWLYPGIVPSRGVFVLGGHAGVGKTTMAYDAAVSFLLDEEFLGEKPARKGKVLIVCADELPCFTQDKLIDRGLPLNNEDWDILTNWDVSQWSDLEEAVANQRPSLLIVDSFASIHRDPNFDENSSQAKKTIYELETLTNTYKCGCIVIHHLSKSKENKGVGRLRGSSAISAAASVVCLLDGMDDSPTRTLSFPKVRGAQTGAIKCQLDLGTGRFRVVSGGDDAQTKSLAEKLLNFFKRDPYTRYEVSEVMGELNLPHTQRDAVYQALGRLHRKGLIIKRPSSQGGKRRVYGLANPHDEPTVTSTHSPQKTQEESYTPPSDKVSVQIAEDVDVVEFEVTDTFTDTFTDTELTLSSETTLVSDANEAPVGDSAELTDTLAQGGVSPTENDLSGETGTTPTDPDSPCEDIWFEEIEHKIFDEFGELIGDNDDSEKIPLESVKGLMQYVDGWGDLETLLQSTAGTFTEFWGICTDPQRAVLSQLRIDAGLEPFIVIEDTVEDASQTLVETLGGELIDLSEEASLPQKQVPAWMVSDPHYLDDLPNTPLGNLIRVLDCVGSFEEFKAAVEGLEVELIDEAITMQNSHHKRQQLGRWLEEYTA